MLKLDFKTLFLYGGLSSDSEPLGDGWLLNTINYQWTKIETKFEPRIWHSALLSESYSQIYVFGGSATDVFKGQNEFPDHLLQIGLTPDTLER